MSILISSRCNGITNDNIDPLPVSCLIRISLIGSDGVHISTALVKWFKHSENGSVACWSRLQKYHTLSWGIQTLRALKARSDTCW